jgi:spore maturation protein SpmA/spore maturation protein SpmB
MKFVFYGMIAIAFVAAAFNQLFFWELVPVADRPALIVAAQATGALPPEFRSPMDLLTSAALDSAKASVNLAIGLIGGMALFLGVMKVAEEGGMLIIFAKLLRPITVRLFPDVPPNHPAMGAMILNMSANALGLGNAATPFGIRAMQELDKLNPHKGTATNAMALFLAINTSALALLPTGVMVIRQELGSTDPGAIFGTTLVATTLSTIAGISAAKLYQRFAKTAAQTHERARQSGQLDVEDAAELSPKEHQVDHSLTDDSAYPGWVSALAVGSLFGFIAVLVAFPLLNLPNLGPVISPWVIPSILFGMLTFGMMRGVNVYATLVSGAKAGFDVAVLIIPYLVAILVAVGLFRASGAMGFVTGVVGPFTAWMGLPAEALPMAMLRPLSGSGASGIMMDILATEGPDSYTGLLVSTLQGSTETTFYVIAVYFGAVQVKRIRHTMAAALTADLFGIIGAVGACLLLYGNAP